jgi:hypothetical protein
MQNHDDEHQTMLQAIATAGERLRGAMTTLKVRVQHGASADVLAYDIGMIEDELLNDLLRVQALICGIPLPSNQGRGA